MIINKVVSERAAWVGPDIQNSSEWLLYLDEDELKEIDIALNKLKDENISIPFAKEDFKLPTLSKRIQSLYDILENQLGFALIRGVDREKYIDNDCELIYWGIGIHLGTPVSQNTRGHLLGHVTDEGKSISDPTTRMYQTKLKMDFHSDQLPVDVVGLFCQRKAKKGGASFLVSALTIHNVLMQERPDLVEILHQPFNLDWRGENPEGEKPWYTCPMFSFFDGKLTSRITSRAFFESVSRHGEDLALSDKQREALDVVQEISERESLRLSMGFQEGDLQFINNHQILHAREDYEDYDDPKLRRHLLRMWLSFPKEYRRNLSPELMERYAFVEAGGIPKRDAA
ncbi:MAG: TauD/TfdA family dioxygenase [Hyphomicrobiales bacterium]|nr:TauD/TfdA family dioxygenase [Hyphomicrobiales bacterium]